MAHIVVRCSQLDTRCWTLLIALLWAATGAPQLARAQIVRLPSVLHEAPTGAVRQAQAYESTTLVPLPVEMIEVVPPGQPVDNQPGEPYYAPMPSGNFPTHGPTSATPGNAMWSELPPNAQTAGFGSLPDAYPGSDCADCGVVSPYECVDMDPFHPCQGKWSAQLLPEGIIYHSYLAGPKEPRMAAIFWHDPDLGWNLDYTVGARVGLFRWGSQDPIWPQGFQIDFEGAGFPRVNLTENMDLDLVDFRLGFALTYGWGRWQTKLSTYHLSAHAGDELLERDPTFDRINYVRDSIVWGLSCYPVDDVRFYGEIEAAFHTDGGAKPLIFQFGAEYSPLKAVTFRGAPFAAVNVSLRQEVDYGGSLTFQTGWQWRSALYRRLLRTGLHWQTGKSNQFEVFEQTEHQLGWGVWYDF